MDVLKFLSICYKSGAKSLVHENANVRESFQGIIIESYYSIFCANITTKFGQFRVRAGESSQTNDQIEEYIKSRITYKMIVTLDECSKTGCVGPFYLVTHIDGEPIEHASVDGITFKTYGLYIQLRTGYPDEFAALVEDCMKRRQIDDTCGYIERLIMYPDEYSEMVEDLVKGLEYPQYRRMPRENKYFHMFGLLFDRKLLTFKLD